MLLSLMIDEQVGGLAPHRGTFSESWDSANYPDAERQGLSSHNSI